MTATVSPSTTSITEYTESEAGPSLWRAGASAGAMAAVATTVVAALALAADVPVEVGGESIPLLGFAQMTLVCTLLGVLIAKGARRWASHPQTAFVRTTVALTALSLVPDLTADATTATIVTLMLTHLVAAAIVIPTLAKRLER
jgi:hypothetical protein